MENKTNSRTGFDEAPFGPPGRICDTWHHHTALALESKTVFYASKARSYRTPEMAELAPWAPVDVVGRLQATASAREDPSR